jgi:broad specificity phosphatase PhoE
MAIPKTVAELANMYGTIDDTYESLNPVVSNGDVADVPEGSPKYEESEDALLKRCAKTVELLLQEHSANGDSFAIVSHAPCDQAVAIHLEGATSTAESLLGPWPLGGITKFSRILGVDGRHGEWTLEKYADTEHMPGKYKPGIKEWSLPCLSKDQQNQ